MEAQEKVCTFFHAGEKCPFCKHEYSEIRPPVQGRSLDSDYYQELDELLDKMPFLRGS